jgi:murein DD-endopeptidase MepM/ murein hydrolase activator NlpD
MPEETGTDRLVGRCLAYPMLLLLASALVAGCAAHRPAVPSAGDNPVLAGTPTASPPASQAATPSGGPPASGPPANGSPANGSPATQTNLRYVFPVRAENASYHPTHSAYPGTDIFAACGTPVLAVTDGRLLEVSRVDQFDKKGPLGPLNGGKAVSLLGDDGVRYYGSHLSEVAAGMAAGVRVRAGQQVGSVGRTGNANNVCHLHFGISPPCDQTDDWWIRRGVVWPAPYLDAWRGRVNRSPADKVTAWQRDHGCPPALTTAGGGTETGRT